MICVFVVKQKRKKDIINLKATNVIQRGGDVTHVEIVAKMCVNSIIKLEESNNL